MINYPDLARRLSGRNVKDDADMPAAYRAGARSLHDDWGLWPFTRIPRRATTFRLPFPSRKVDGNADPIWTPIDPAIKLAPGTEIRALPWWDGEKSIIRPHVLSMHPVHPIGLWSTQAVYLDGEWRPCYTTSSRLVFGRRLYTNRGLKPDLNDFIWNWPEASLTWT